MILMNHILICKVTKCKAILVCISRNNTRKSYWLNVLLLLNKTHNSKVFGYTFCLYFLYLVLELLYFT
jgi:hypothetical protein